MAEYKKQHFLPRFYLENFSFEYKTTFGTTQNIFFLKQGETKLRHKAIENVAVESYYYSIQNDLGEYDHELEKFLGMLEQHAAPIIRALIEFAKNGKNRDRYRMIGEQREILASFTMWMYLRSPYVLEMLKGALVKPLEDLRTRHDLPYRDPKQKSEFIKSNALSVLRELNQDDEIFDLFFNKQFYLFAAPNDRGFITSDNPLTILYKGKKIHDPDAEIHLPLGHELLLLFLGPRVDDQVMLNKAPHGKIIRECNYWTLKNAHSIVLGKSEALLSHLMRKSKAGMFVPQRPRFSGS